VIALYFFGTVRGKQIAIARQPYKEIRWVEPLEVFRYFTSSTTDEVTRFLTSLQS
jgi:hypothetical protein